jgi:RimJ/RimL family protein N-acetyltransferase
MTLTVREMTASETGIIIDYFQNATPEFLETLGVDPTRFPPENFWRERMLGQIDLPVERRATVLAVWLSDGRPVGFSTADKIRFGEQANMHLHVTESERRNTGIGAACVHLTVDLYFERLKLKRLFCEPYAFNAAPNRTLQKAGFKYLKTYMTVPGPLNFHQAVNRWVVER